VKDRYPGAGWAQVRDFARCPVNTG
jgi:hypothetical protein